MRTKTRTKTLYSWKCRRCDREGFFAAKWPDHTHLIYRAPVCCGLPMRAHPAGGSKQVQVLTPGWRLL